MAENGNTTRENNGNSAKKAPVLVLSRNYSTGLGVVRSLGEAGHPVRLISSVKKRGSSTIVSSSRYVDASEEVLTVKSQGDGGEALIRAVMGEAPKEGKMLLIPVDDFTMMVADENRMILEERFIMPFVEDGTKISSFMDKSLQLKRAEQTGFNVPESKLVSLEGRIKIPDNTIYPCFVKPAKSAEGDKNEMAVIHSRDELKDHLAKMKTFYKKRSVLIQEYLDIDKEYDICGVSLGNRAVIPAVLEKKRIAGFERGVTMVGKMIATESLGDSLKDRLVEMLSLYRYHGLFDLELDLAGGKLYFGEINFRSGGPGYAYTIAGVNLPEILASELLECRDCRTQSEGCIDQGVKGKKLEVADNISITLGKTYVYEKVAWEDYIYGFITRKELNSELAEADEKLLDRASDPRPGKVFGKRIRLSVEKHKLMRLLGIKK